MSKYNRLPGIKENEPIVKEAPKMPISKLCCLPILMEGNKGYKRQLDTFMSLEELMPKVQRMQIYQMMYMDKLLEQLREYKPQVKEEHQKDPFEIIAGMDKSGNTAKTMNMVSKIAKYQQSGDISVLLELIAPNNPMLSMILPMLSMQGSTGGSGMMESLLPMMMGGNMDMLSSMFKM